MNDETQSRRDALAVRYNLSAQPEWQQFLVHFDLSQNFALVVLLVVDADGADLCRMELEKQLKQEGKQLVSLDLTSPEQLRHLPTQLPVTQLPPDTGGLWIAGVAPDYAPDFLAWQEAWQFALARLNSLRNDIRRQFNTSLIFVGAPWLQETMREIAPDLWSVRTLVARIEPQVVTQTLSPSYQTPSSSPSESSAGGDPLFALQEADKFRGVRGNALTIARLLHRAGERFATRDDWRSAEKAYTEALELKQTAGAPPESLLATLIELAAICQALGQIQRSLDYAQSALVLARQTNNQSSEGKALGYLGNAFADLGELSKATECYKQALVLSHRVNDRHEEVDALNNLGKVYWMLGDMHKAIEFHEQQRRVAHDIVDRRGEVKALGNLGVVFDALGDFHKAIDYFNQARAIAREMNYQSEELRCLNNLGLAYIALGDMNAAIVSFEESLVITRKIGDSSMEGIVLNNLGNAFAKLDDTSKAMKCFQQALTIARQVGDQNGEGNALWNTARELCEAGELAQAITLAETALKIYEAVKSPYAAQVRAKLAEWRAAKP